jgi:hypothetical protein
MARKPSALARLAAAGHAPLQGDAKWLLNDLASGCRVVGKPKGLNPKKPTPWTYELLRFDTRGGTLQVVAREEVKAATITLLTQRGLVSGRAGSGSDGQPEIVFTVSATGMQEHGKLVASGALTAETKRGGR